VAAAVLLAAPLAFAQDQAATAEALFREARDLAAKGRFEEACPKFAASQKLDPGFGTLYNLGECRQRQGKNASAWAAFSEAAALAHSAGQSDREVKATKAVKALEGKLERMTISVSAPVPGLAVKRGGVTIDAAAFGSALPVDAGKHVIEVTAPGKKPYTTEVSTGGPGNTVTVTIPALEDAPAEPAVTPGQSSPVPPSEGSAPARRIAGFVSAGVGVAGIVVGAVMGASAKSKWNDAQTNHCRTSTLCDAAGVDLVGSARTSATVSTIGFLAGGALVATGVVLIVTALPSKGAATTGRLVISPVLDPTHGGLWLSGSF
jgi:hypothetical protein